VEIDAWHCLGYNLFIEKIRMVTWIFYPSYTSLF